MNQPTNTTLPGGGIELALDRPRVLRLTFNSLVALGKATGANPLHPDFWRSMDDPERLRAALWACLIHEDKALTIEQVGDLVDPTRLGEIAQAVASAVSASMPSKKESPSAQPAE